MPAAPAHGHDHAHGHAHDNAHGHGHGHAHLPASFGRAFAIGVVLNAGYVVAEIVYGLAAHSLTLLADAGHNAGDVLALLAAWLAASLARRAPSAGYTYGLRASSILAALGNGVVLMLVTGAIAWEAVRRLLEPAPVAGGTVMAVAAVGVVVNGLTAWLFAAGRKGDLNVRGAFLHMAGDALVALGTVLAGALIWWTGRLWIDPVVSLIVSVVIVAGTWGLLRDSVRLALDGVPPGIDAARVRDYLAALPGIGAVHDLHIWGMSTTETALTAHLVCETGAACDALLHDAAAGLLRQFGIAHTTLQLETGDPAFPCRQEPNEVV